MTGREHTIELTDEEMKSQNILYAKYKAFNREINEGSTVRLIYQGKLLTDEKKLSEYNFKSNPHIHAIVTSVSNQSSNIEQNSTAPSRNSDELKNQILDEIQMNLQGTHLTRAERDSMIQYQGLVNRSSPSEIEL